MINADMRPYNFYAFGEDNDYGEPQLIKDEQGNPVVQGAIKMAINIISQTISDKIVYKDATYLGLTLDSKVDDTYVIQYGSERLKVLYVNPRGRYKQVFMSAM